jgi:hypothetical protein
MKVLPATLLAALCAIAPARAATGAEALQPLEGNWESSATATNTAYSKAGSTTATTSCAWSVARDYLICQQNVTSAGQVTHDVAVYTYDAASAKYHFYAIRSNGISDVGIAVDTTGIMYTNAFTDAGKTVTVRTMNVWDDPDHYRFWTEYTSDGVHWVRMLTGTAHRSPQATP